MQLRWYQDEAIGAIVEYFRSGKKGNPVVALPTGTGKSVVLGGFIKYVMQSWPGQRLMMLTHVKELVEQNARKLQQLWPEAPVGIHSAGLKQRDIAQPIIFGGVASVVKRIEQFGHRDLLLIDECHLLSDSSTTMYQQVIEGLRRINPKLRVIGLTATPYRMKMGLITDGSIFTDICYDLCDMDGFDRLLKDGYLSPPVAKATTTELNVNGLKMVGGDFAKKELEHAVDTSEITYSCIAEMLEKGGDRHCWLIFATGIDHAEHVADTCNMFGIEALAVHSKLPAGERDRRLHMFKTGQIECIVNNGILTTGFDHPPVDMIGMLRPTMSPGLWVQMLGRGTRPYDCNNDGMYIPGFDYQKENCLVLDFAGNTKRLGPINDPKVPGRKKKGGGDAPVKICPECGTYNHASARYCGGESFETYGGCGFEFVFTPNIEEHASEQPLLKTKEPIIELFKVDKLEYSAHIKQGSPKILKVVYHCGLRHFDEYVCLDHAPNTFACKKARNWWTTRELKSGAFNNLSPSVDEALTRVNDLPYPSHIKVDVNKKYPDIIDYVF